MPMWDTTFEAMDGKYIELLKKFGNNPINLLDIITQV